jgi:hypothetical protein
MSGWTNHSERVTSQNISENEMGNRGSKSEIQSPQPNEISVKEQRVDGSSVIFYNNCKVYSSRRWKPVFSFYSFYKWKVSSSIINLTAYLRFVYKRMGNLIKRLPGTRPGKAWGSLHSKSFETLSSFRFEAARFYQGKGLNPWFVTGLIDAEGCFNLGISAAEGWTNINIIIK